jgi:hypothetical protein
VHNKRESLREESRETHSLGAFAWRVGTALIPSCLRNRHRAGVKIELADAVAVARPGPHAA